MLNIVRRMGLSSGEIAKSLQAFAPLSLAEKWDNVGVLVDSMSEKPVETLLLTNDLTEDVLEEAVENQVGFIISYHPNIFQGLKQISSRTWKERLVVQCIKNGITVYSPHTSWDSVEGGVNDWLSNALPFTAKRPIIIPDVDNNPFQGAGRWLSMNPGISIKSAVENIKKHIGIPHLRLALARGKTEEDLVNSVALCAGSGGSVLNGFQKAELYLTGEMQHHDVLDATQKGIHVILTNHSDSERGFLAEFQKKLQDQILGGRVKVLVSKRDKDPLITV